jgi:cyclophilin family peptidyl-prolyl cis-trans isomerase
MAIADRDTLGSHFIITLKADHHLDRFANLIFFGVILRLTRMLYFVCEGVVQ